MLFYFNPRADTPEDMLDLIGYGIHQNEPSQSVARKFLKR